MGVAECPQHKFAEDGFPFQLEQVTQETPQPTPYAMCEKKPFKMIVHAISLRTKHFPQKPHMSSAYLIATLSIKHHAEH